MSTPPDPQPGPTPPAPSRPDSAGDRERGRKIALAAVVACCAIGLVLRVLAARTDPWLDEIWSFALLPRMLAATDVFFHLHHANNHPLNTLFLYWLGDAGEAFWWYRVHTVLAGVATIALAARIAARRGAPEAVFAALLFATSFLLVHHSSQARGYALMLLGALGAFHALQCHHDRPSLASSVAYAACVVWSLFANLYFLYLLLALSLWSAVVAIERAGGLRPALLPLLRLQAAPFAALAFVMVSFYLPGLSGSQFATHHYGIIAQAASLLLGGPFMGPVAYRLLWVGVALVGFGLFVLRRDRDREWLFYLLAIAVAPALVIAATRPKALFVRFFAGSEVFALLLVALVLGWLWRARTPGRVLAVAVAAAIVWGNALHIERLIERGRGQYLAALQYMARQSLAADLVVGSDHSFATEMTLRFYDRLVPEVRVVFIPEQDRAKPPEWFVRVGYPRPLEFQYAGHLYDRDRSFPSGGFGFDWQLYHRVPMADAIRRKTTGSRSKPD